MRTWQFNATGTPQAVLSQLTAYADIPPHVKVAFIGMVQYAMLPKIAAKTYTITSSGTVGGEYSQSITAYHDYK
jgi:hypothetical protein